MLIGVVLLLLLVSVPLAGGHLTRLADLRWIRPWVVLLGIGVQVVIISVVPEGHHGLHTAAHIASYLLVASFIVYNAHIPALWIIGAGGLMNFAAISANGGVMPASIRAMQAAGRKPTADFINSAPVAHPKLLFLGDVFPAPIPFMNNVFSVGDLLIVVGAGIALHSICGSRAWAASRRALGRLGTRLVARYASSS